MIASDHTCRTAEFCDMTGGGDVENLSRVFLATLSKEVIGKLQLVVTAYIWPTR